MHAFSHIAVECDGQTYGPGVFECPQGLLHSFAPRGPVRPATQEEIQHHAQPAPECAAVARDSEQASARRVSRSRREVVTA